MHAIGLHVYPPSVTGLPFRFPLDPRHPLVVCGALLVASLGCALFYDPIGWAWTSAIVCVLLLGIVWPLLIVRWCVVELRTRSKHIELGGEIEIELIRSGPRWLASQPVVVEVEGVQHALAGSSRTLRIKPRRRGRLPARPVRVTCDAPFGLFRASRQALIGASAVVLPVGPDFPVPAGRSENGSRNIVRTTAPSGGETTGLREYRRGDPPRQIHWAATARLDKLIARERTDTSRPAVCVWLDAASFAGAPVDPQSSYERAISIASGMLRSWADAGARIELVMPGQTIRINWRPDLVDALEALALLPDDPKLVEPAPLRGPSPDVLITGSDDASSRVPRVLRLGRRLIDDTETARIVKAMGGREVSHAR